MRECLGQTPPGRFAPDSYRDFPLEGCKTLGTLNFIYYFSILNL
jgi:hypothetical protein